MKTDFMVCLLSAKALEREPRIHEDASQKLE